MPRILFIVHSYPPRIGGSELLTAHLASRLATRGFDVHVSTSTIKSFRGRHNPFVPRLSPGTNVEQGVTIHRHQPVYMPATVPFYLNRLLRKLGASSSDMLELVGYGPYLPEGWALWNSSRWDAVFATSIPSQTALLPPLLRRLGLIDCPVLLHTAFHPHKPNLSKSGLMQPLVKGADLVLTNTRAEQTSLRDEHVVGPTQPMRTLGVGVPQDFIGVGRRQVGRRLLGLDENVPTVLFLGRISRDKGVYRILEAMTHVTRRLPEARLVLAGHMLQRVKHNADFQRLLRSLRGTVIGPEPLAEKEKADVIAAADMLALPSRGDSFGIVYLEAWAQGIPVVGLDLPAIGEVIADGGLCAPVEDPRSRGLAVLVEELLTQPKLRDKLATAGLNRLRERFTWQKVADRLEDALKHVL